MLVRDLKRFKADGQSLFHKLIWLATENILLLVWMQEGPLIKVLVCYVVVQILFKKKILLLNFCS